MFKTVSRFSDLLDFGYKLPNGLLCNILSLITTAILLISC